MTPEELDAIEARANAATPGPWASTWAHTEHDAVPAEQLDEAAIVSSAEGLARDAAVVVGSLWYDGPHTVCREPDAAFIAAARTDVPALVAEVRRLRAEVEGLRGALKSVRDVAEALAHGARHADGCPALRASECTCGLDETEAKLYEAPLLALLGIEL